MTERERIAQAIAQVRAEQKRMPVHWVDRREAKAEQLDALIREWLDSE